MYFSIGVLVEHIVEHRQPPELGMVESAVKFSTIKHIQQIVVAHELEPFILLQLNSYWFSRCQVEVHRNNLYTKTTPLFTGGIRS